MKTINELAKDYAIENSLIGHEKPPYRGFIAGFEEAQRWFDVSDRENIMPNNTDFLIKLEDGRVFRFNEDWQCEMQMVTHWRPIQRT